jgi:cell division protein FtsB
MIKSPSFRETALWFRSWRDWINPIPLAAIALFLIFGWYMTFGDEGLLTLRRLAQTKDSLLHDEQALTHRLQELHHETRRLRNPAYLEILLRKEYGYVKEGEQVFQFPETSQRTEGENP